EMQCGTDEFNLQYVPVRADYSLEPPKIVFMCPERVNENKNSKDYGYILIKTIKNHQKFKKA
ncbi:MAG: hypothetical protein ACRC3A_03140, partial [Culicoidibacterales bacterium]